MDFAGTEKTAMLLGTMPGQTRVEDVLSILADKAPEVEGVEVQIISSEPDTVYTVSYTHLIPVSERI